MLYIHIYYTYVKNVVMFEFPFCFYYFFQFKTRKNRAEFSAPAGNIRHFFFKDIENVFQIIFRIWNNENWGNGARYKK